MSTNHNKLVILSGNAHPTLANDIASELNIKVGNVLVSKFANSETQVLINESVRDPTCNPCVNDYLMELLVMVDGAKRASAHRITAVVPFFGYARQSKKDKSRAPITCKLVANMMEVSGIDRVITIDLHSSQIQGFFNIPVENVYSDHLFTKYIKKRIIPTHSDYIIVAPGVGGVKRAKKIADELKADLAIIHKANIASSDSETMLVGDVKDKVAIIIDDIADTCSTLNSATVTLMRRGATKIFACVTHGVFSNNAIDIINEGSLSQLVITDSVPNSHNLAKCPKLKIVSISSVLAETIRRVHNGESIEMEVDTKVTENSEVVPNKEDTAATTTAVAHGRNRIKEGDNVVLNINNGEQYKNVRLVAANVNGSSNQLNKVNPKEMDEQLLRITEISNNQEANNSTLTPYNTSQKLTGDDIKGLKEKGSDYKDVITALIDNSSSFHTKTAYSQVKYLKKKMAKHSTLIRILKPSLKTLCESYYAKDAKKICHLRFDTFGRLLTHANVRAGIRVLVVESAMGIVTGAIAERMGGDGEVLSAFIGKGPSLSIAQNFGFEEKVEKTIYSFSIELINKLNAEALGDNTVTMSLPNSTAGGVYNQNRIDDTTPLLKDGVNSLVIVTQYHPLNILKACLPYLNPSGNIVIFSQFQQHLVECFQFLHENMLAVNISVAEIWMREQQVLPKRTHPNMNMDGSSGFLLSAIKVKGNDTKATTLTTTTSTSTSTITMSSNNKDIKMTIKQDEIEQPEEEEEEEEVLKKRKREDDNTTATTTTTTTTTESNN
ncbi:phosphoribosyl pyrophosphate synthetase [Heterostelium album PN500]|uniref:ribose-phosphate diphosphokinase n=1 Tax=Heterostelium pallidum (strain ATCC 26659 / Pp 5 / PN500) TaxID=670386 RepID=D3BIG0_HETP5|nr:phosphoribosyl pyrophosphate synthetase [Heterostelium album PN500]EFA79060.1 phosphoribosyl pyrophosphate synthetase [Heterostelium album PN500]|eukprot:XP_020431183.1 phosphoribosyl pyrophosphate synthetase [Heterostelium album PN500]